MPQAPLVILTREPDDNREIAAQLHTLAIPVKEYPCIRTVSLSYEAGEPVDGRFLEEYPIIVFTSKRGVAGMKSAVPLLSTGSQELAVVGKTTAAAVLEYFYRKPGIVAHPSTGEALARELKSRFPKDKHILHVRGNKTTGTFKTVMEAEGFTVSELEVYRNDCQEIEPLPLRELENAIIVFASPSAAGCFFRINPGTAKGTVYVCIGPVTASYLEKKGRAPVITASEPGTGPLVEKIKQCYMKFSRAGVTFPAPIGGVKT